MSSERGGFSPVATTISVFAVLYLLAAWSLDWLVLGVVRAPNLIEVLYLGALLGGAMLWLASIGILIFAIRAHRRGRYSQVPRLFFAAALAFASPVIARSTADFFIRRAELRDLQRVGVDALRIEVTALVALNKERSYPPRYFGGVVPSEEVPPKIRELARRASYVVAAEEGVVLVIDGFASWRGGYMITPTASTFVPANSRQIADGVYYVTVRK